tara:strand:- start:1262 stop:1948 length:687 start_codon:yes stop_codon:yes gene_type:complete
MNASLEDLHLLDIPHMVVDDINETQLSSENKHHFLNVRRLRSGQKVTITDGSGSWQICELEGNSLLKIGERQFTGTFSSQTTVCIAITKSGKPELVTQKLTELGVGSIHFFFSERSVPQWDTKKMHKNMEKLTIISKQALAQSKGVWLPKLEIGTSFNELIKEEGMCMADRRGSPGASGIQKIMIGPEGGWGQVEYQSPVSKVRLHNLNLRSETAAIVAGAIIVSAFE